MDERGWQTAAWAVAAVVAVLLGMRALGGGDGEAPPVRVAGGGAREPAAGRGGARPGPYVHVAGAVRRPGLYRLAAGSRVAGALRRAGGPRASADLDRINLAARVQDGQQVVVPARAGAGGGAPAGGADAPLSLGAATVEQLDGLDGIGPTLARRIVARRQATGGFASLDELRDVEGIGEKRLAALKAALAP